MLDTENTIQWWQSRSVWGGIVAVLTPIIGNLLKIEIDDAAQTQLVNLIMQVVGAVGGFVALEGRLTAKKQIAPASTKPSGE